MSEWMTVNEAHGRLLAAEGLTAFDDWMNVARECETPRGREESLTVFELGGADGFRVYLKRLRPSRMTPRFFLRRSRQRCEAENARRLRKLGLNAPEVIAAGERRRLGCVTASFVATREIPGTRTLLECVTELRSDSTPECRQARREILDELARAVRRMHDARYIDHDLYGRNVLVRDTDTGRREVYIIDSPRGGLRRLGFERARVRDLASLDRDVRSLLSRTDRLRFLKTYLGHPRLTPDDRALARRIVRRGDRREAERRRR